MKVTMFFTGHFASYRNFEVNSEEELIELLNGNKISQWQFNGIVAHYTPGFDLEKVHDEIADEKVRKIFYKCLMRRNWRG